jgi:hypothetical protein
MLLMCLTICLHRLDERKRRKEFILERNLLYPNPLEKDLTNEDKEVYHRYKVFMRFLTKEEHEALIRSVIEERKIRRRIQELQVLYFFPKFTWAHGHVFSLPFFLTKLKSLTKQTK